MSNKNINKLLAFTAIAGAAVAAGIAYFKHKNSDLYDDDFDDLDDDFDDEDFDFPLPTDNNSDTPKREYVSLNIDKESSTESELNSVEESNTKENESSDSSTDSDQAATLSEESKEDKTV
jgi:hypothetical protein